MPVSAIVISLKNDASRRERALEMLEAHPHLELGELQNTQLPVVVETDTIAEGVRIVREELPALDGVEFVHVVSVDFSDVDAFDEKLPPRRRRAQNAR
ncbi:hypothetical protein FIV42_05390 [Persicimonas caeni]|jgi:hypothetical protein|uniref:Uncharacterized protein n=1 Tax=Persicimonas caeni TaxID=2292766 RepID=A0A4Y6PPB4_PERCE|nr:hypothetical protein [Persicimonas caeni]QDG50182.1 hypothetical protein FIV42_05390 [Persicimonas caeni]QED31403.1 hypothetical protein FRD00_05385 [Persicimonas caeni]